MRNNNHRTSVAAALVLACFCVDPANAVEFAIVHAGQLLAVPGEEVLDEHSIVISDGRISDVLPGYVSGSDVGAGAADTVTIHNLRDMFVMPGLIDGHVHLTGEFGPRYRLDAVELSNPDLAIQGAHFARLTLMAGFTTVRDLGAWGGDAIIRVTRRNCQRFRCRTTRIRRRNCPVSNRRTRRRISRFPRRHCKHNVAHRYLRRC